MFWALGYGAVPSGTQGRDLHIMSNNIRNRADWSDKSTSEKGFTLIELLVVIAILGVLAVVGVLSFGGLTKRTTSLESRQSFLMPDKLFFILPE